MFMDDDNDKFYNVSFARIFSNKSRMNFCGNKYALGGIQRTETLIDIHSIPSYKISCHAFVFYSSN